MTGNMLNIGDLSKPAEKLIDKVSDAIGGALRPWQIERVAVAEAKSKMIQAKADIAIESLRQRAKKRVENEEVLKQLNMESILGGSLGMLKQDADPSKVSNDWLLNFFDKARLVSEAEMQMAWSKLLAEEVNKAGTFSKRSVNVLASLDSLEAHNFNSLCRLLWKFKDDDYFVVITDFQSKGFKATGLSFNEIHDLASAGLLHYSDSLTGFSASEITLSTSVAYHDKVYKLQFSEDENEKSVPIGLVLLTSAGHELAALSSTEPIELYREEVLAYWKTRNLAFTEQ